MFNIRFLLFVVFGLWFIQLGEMYGQCDLEIYDFDPETLDVTMIVHDGYGCNPNDLTDDEIDKFILGITSNELQANNFTCGLGEGVRDGLCKTSFLLLYFGTMQMHI